MLQGFLIIIGMVICYMVGRGVMGAMGIIMFDTLAGLIIKPIIIGFFAIIICLGVLGLLFKVLLWCAPFLLIIGLIVALVNALRRNR